MPMPDFIRDAIRAQGKVDPDEVEAKAALVNLDAETEAEQLRLLEANEKRKQAPEERAEEWWQK